MPVRILILTALFILPLLPTFWAIQDIPKRRFATHRKKILWFLLVSSLPFVGAMLYILLVRRHTKPLVDAWQDDDTPLLNGAEDDADPPSRNP